MNAGEIVVVGGISVDLVFSLPRLPGRGETVEGSLATNPGGKGARQAVAAARLGCPTALVGCIGDDSWGNELLSGLRREGVDCDFVDRVEGATGCAGIFAETGGENAVAVAFGANAMFGPDKLVVANELIRGAKVLMGQLEIPLETVKRALELAKEAGATTILKPAPAQSLPSELLGLVDYLTPNASEASVLAGLDVHCWNTAAQAARELRNKGVGTVIVTMGPLGAFFSSPEGEVRISAPRVEAIDATVAGDAFNGALAVALVHDVAPDIAADFAAAAAAMAVGARASLPTLADLRRGGGLPWR